VSVTVLQDVRKRLEPQLRRIFHLYWRIARGMTLGVRGVVLDGDNKVFLVKHSYVSGWHLPGGGVEVGETFLEALRRELIEEGRIELTDEPDLHGLFFNGHVSRRDHVAVYVVRQFRQDRLPEPNREIVACGFYDAAALPVETTKGTRLRIAEVLDGKARIATWR
jgi:8-oxo-dGTP pyrophosphatase MutT (NUDIX family)